MGAEKRGVSQERIPESTHCFLKDGKASADKSRFKNCARLIPNSRKKPININAFISRDIYKIVSLGTLQFWEFLVEPDHGFNR